MIIPKNILDVNSVKKQIADAAKGTGAFGEFSGASGDPDKVRLTKGGTPRDWQALNEDERWAVFQEAGLSNTWLNVSFQTPRAFGEIIDSTQALINGYKTALEAGKTLMYANRTLALATLNPAVFALEQLIELAEKTIDDIMGTGLYVLFVNSQDLNEKDHKVKSRNYNLEFNRFNLSGLSINPFTNNLFFHVQPIEDINLLAAKSRQYDQAKTEAVTYLTALGSNPYEPRIRHYRDNPGKYLIYNGKVFDRITKKAVLTNAAKHYDIPSDLLKFVTSPFQNWKVCPPTKMLKIINESFDDKLDLDKPTTSDNGRVGALIMIAGTTDPTKIAAKVVKLYNYFSSGGPLARAANVFLNAMNTTYKYRTEEIVVENLCAPNNFDNPAEKDWPFIAGEDVDTLSSRDEWRLGHNSDNFVRYGGGIKRYNQDKVILKNLRTKEIMQIISVGEPERIEVPSTRGPDVVMTSEGQVVYSEQPGGDPELPMGTFSTDGMHQGLDIFNAESQTKKIRYRQKIIVQHQDFIIGTLPGDTLVEVEVSGFLKMNTSGASKEVMSVRKSDESEDAQYVDEDTSGVSGFWNNFTKTPIFTLKNGTPFYDTTDVEEVFRMIMLDRLVSQRILDQSKLIKAYFHYSNKINTNPQEYRHQLTYFVNVPESEALNYLQGISAWKELTTLPDGTEKEESLAKTLNTYPRNEEEATLWLEIKALDEIIKRQTIRNNESYADLGGGLGAGSNRRQVAELQTQIDLLNRNINDKDSKISGNDTEYQAIESDLTNYNSIKKEIQEAFPGTVNESYEEVIEYQAGDIDSVISDYNVILDTKRSRMTDIFEKSKTKYIDLRWEVMALELGRKNYRETWNTTMDNLYTPPETWPAEEETAARNAVDSEFMRFVKREGDIIVDFDNVPSEYMTIVDEYRETKTLYDETLTNHGTKIKLQQQLKDSSLSFNDRLIALIASDERLASIDINSSLRDTLDQLETIIYNRKEDLTSISTKNSIILAEKSKLISERDSLVIARTSVLTEAEFDDIESSLTSLERRRQTKFSLLEQMIANRSFTLFGDPDLFTLEKVASGRFQRKRGYFLQNELSYDFSEDDIADYEIVMDQSDSEARTKFQNLLEGMITRDEDNIIEINWSNYDTYNLEFTDAETEKAISLFFGRSSMDIDPGTLAGDMKNFFENMLDQHLYLPRYKQTGSQMPAPRYCNVLTKKPLEEETPKVTAESEGMYPNWNDYTLEEILPGFRDALNLIVTLLDSTKGALETTIKAIDDIIEFIEEEIIPQLEEIIDIIQEFVDILKIGIIDAGIWFLYVPAEVGGVKRIRKALTSAQNAPPENIDFTFGTVLLTSSAGQESTKQEAFDILEPILGLS